MEAAKSDTSSSGSAMFQGAVAVDSRAHSEFANEQRIQGLNKRGVGRNRVAHRG